MAADGYKDCPNYVEFQPLEQRVCTMEKRQLEDRSFSVETRSQVNAVNRADPPPDARKHTLANREVRLQARRCKDRVVAVVGHWQVNRFLSVWPAARGSALSPACPESRHWSKKERYAQHLHRYENYPLS